MTGYNPEYYKKWREKIKSNPVQYQAYLAQQRGYGAISRKRRTQEQKEKIKKKTLIWRTANAEKIKQVSKKWREAVKNRIFNHYGRSCVCCGESHFEFLVIDHINGGGNKHRKILGRLGTAFYKWLENQNFPVEYRVLCHNCNQSLGCYGYCPHFNLSASGSGVMQSGNLP